MIQSKTSTYAVKTTELPEIVMGRMVMEPGSRIYVNLNGRDITQITHSANSNEGWAIVFVTDGNGNALLTDEGEAATAQLGGDVQILLEKRINKVKF